MDFLHGFVHGFFARIFCADSLHELYCTDFRTDFLNGFLGVSQSTC